VRQLSRDHEPNALAKWATQLWLQFKRLVMWRAVGLLKNEATMIRRKYFFSVKVAHNDGSGHYSWWHTILNTKSWLRDVDHVLASGRNMAKEILESKIDRDIDSSDIEVVSLNRI